MRNGPGEKSRAPVGQAQLNPQPGTVVPVKGMPCTSTSCIFGMTYPPPLTLGDQGLKGTKSFCFGLTVATAVSNYSLNKTGKYKCIIIITHPCRNNCTSLRRGKEM